MTKNYFEEMMAELGARAVNGTACGQRGAVYYSAALDKSGSAPQMLFRFAASAPAGALARRLNREKEPHLHWLAEAGEDGPVLLALSAPPSDFYAKSGVVKLLGMVEALVRAGELAAPAACPLCGLGGTDAHAVLRGAYRPVHAACVQTRLGLPDKDSVIPAHAGGRVPTGILGAVLGAFVGALPIFTLAMNQGKLHWALYAFIPILSGLCYRLLRGKAAPLVAALSVLIASIAAAFVLELIWFWLVQCASYGLVIPFGISLGQYFASHNLFSTVREMLTCLLALFAGYMAVTIFLRRYVNEGRHPAQTLRGGDYVRATLASDQPPTPDAPET